PLCSQQMLTQGPIARTAADLKYAFTAMSRRAQNDPLSIPCECPAGNPNSIRVGIHTPEPGEEIAEGTKQAVETAGRKREQAGYRVEAIRLPEMEAVKRLYFQQLLYELHTAV